MCNTVSGLHHSPGWKCTNAQGVDIVVGHSGTYPQSSSRLKRRVAVETVAPMGPAHRGPLARRFHANGNRNRGFRALYTDCFSPEFLLETVRLLGSTDRKTRVKSPNLSVRCHSLRMRQRGREKSSEHGIAAPGPGESTVHLAKG